MPSSLSIARRTMSRRVWSARAPNMRSKSGGAICIDTTIRLYHWPVKPGRLLGRPSSLGSRRSPPLGMCFEPLSPPPHPYPGPARTGAGRAPSRQHRAGARLPMTSTQQADAASPQPALTQASLDALRAALRDRVALPGDDRYAEATTIWNGMIRKRPSAVVRASSIADVVQTVRFAADEGVE